MILIRVVIDKLHFFLLMFVVGFVLGLLIFRRESLGKKILLASIIGFLFVLFSPVILTFVFTALAFIIFLIVLAILGVLLLKFMLFKAVF